MFRHLTSIIRRTSATLIAAAIIAATPTLALADRFDTHRDRGRDDHRDYRQDHRRDDHRRGSGHVGIHIGSYDRPRVIVPPVCEERVWVPPVTRTVSERVWVPATYTTVVDRVWIEPIVRKVEERVWVGDRYEWRDVTRWENGWRVTRREQVLIEAGHYATVCRDEVIAPGRWEDRPRQELVGGHFQTVTREEILAPGHWETRPTRVVVAPPRDQFRFDLRIPIGP